MIQANCILNIGADAELKTINDRQYITFRGASTDKRKDQTDTIWVSVLLSSQNDNLLQYLRKGQQVFVSGRMTAKIYQSQQSFGIDITVFANIVQLCGSKREDQTPPKTSTNQTSTPQDPQSPQSPLTPQTPSDLPF